MRPIVLPLTFNPWLGLAVKGMWTTKPVQLVIEAADVEGSDPSPEAKAA